MYIPQLNERTRGWLRFLWRKATTDDDWGRGGEPHPWWDRYSLPPMLNFPRFDLSESSYALAMMADITPAWRESYTHIMNELIQRHTTFWAAVDWLTCIGHDPNRDKYPKQWKGRLVPKHLWGAYDAPGWTANGVEPWGLEPDPVGSRGNLFFRGFLNLMLALHRYISGEDRWAQPFQVTGLKDQTFAWTHPHMAEFIAGQWEERPEGPHCENTKIWPYCLSAAGLGLQLTDRVLGSSHHRVYHRWVEDVLTKKFMAFDRRGRVVWIGLYYDPLIDHLQAPSAVGGLAPGFYILPQDRPLAEKLYHRTVSLLGWNKKYLPVLPVPLQRAMTLGLVLAQELGDETTARRLRKRVERKFQPRFFGEDNSEFGWWFGLGEAYPRGQESALLMLADIGGEGSWWRIFNEPNLHKFNEPVVTGVDYPKIGLCSAWNDAESASLMLTTYGTESASAGRPTRFRVENLPSSAEVSVLHLGVPYDGWDVVGETAIEIQTTIGEHQFQIYTGYRGQPPTRPDNRYILALLAQAVSCDVRRTLRGDFQRAL